MERTTFKDLAVYYTYTPGQKGGFDQPEVDPVVEFQSIYFIDATGKEHKLTEKTEEALMFAFGGKIEKEILS